MSSAWWQQMDEDEHYQESFSRATDIREEALSKNDYNQDQAFGWLSMLVVELQDEICALTSESPKLTSEASNER